MSQLINFGISAAASRLSRTLARGGCILYSNDELFRLPSGWSSPCYADCRKLLTFSRAREELVTMSVEPNDLRQELKTFLDNPIEWSSKHGGISSLKPMP